MKNVFKKGVIYLLTLESRLVLKKYKPKIIAVTGTVGKTSTKDAIFTALSRTLSVRKTQKSQNSEFGIPLTILNCGNPSTSIKGWVWVLIEGLKLISLPHHYPEWLILEIGADHPGDIESTMRWVHPDISVVTKLSKVPVHVEFFPSVEDVAREKSQLIRGLKSGGIAVLNADDEDVMAFAGLAHGRIVTFGLTENADVSASRYEVLYDEEERPSGIQFVVLDKKTGDETPVILKGTLGTHLMYPILAALAVVDAVGESVAVAAKGFRAHEPTPGRMRLIEGIHGSTIIDDTYNSSPVALEEALKTLQGLKVTRRIAVIGDMLELGKYSIDEHKKAGQLAMSCARILVTVGPRARYAAESAREAGMAEVYDLTDSREAGTFLKEHISKGDAVLVKGSQGVRAERVVEALIAEPQEKAQLLVRQDKEWQDRDRNKKA